MDLENFFQREQFGSFINGHFDQGNHKAIQEFISPVTKKVWKKYFPVGDQDTSRAIEAASMSLPLWRHTPAPTRGKILRSCADALVCW
jgi:acyl-CoA reductase-like NAD-dependent aldehyde dehydrogenase